jgi:hypothetical protein
MLVATVEERSRVVNASRLARATERAVADAG